MRHDKLDRELTLMLLMTENRRYTVQQLCERMDISKRTLYYYLDFFRDIGFIVEKHGTVYSLDKSSPFFTKLFRKVHFTEDEAVTMRRILDSSGSHSAMVEHLKHKLDSLYDLNILDDEQLRERQALNLSVIYDAIKYHRSVVLHHYSSPHSNSISNRIVEPFMLMNNNNEVRCYELTSGMNKTFKLSRMERVELLADEWEHEAEHRQIYTDIFMFSAEEQLHVTLLLGRLSYNLMLEEYPKAEAYIIPKDSQHWLLELDVCSYAGIGRFVLGLYEDITIVGDEGFKDYIRQHIQQMLKV
ncbi:MAG: WYL domain-containing transcriptional regulator [Prevotella sp.]|nr:WYL domain-containing transcriptional regulator [Prevotella sp.]MBQ8714112.1 WYL domain-containing transcriptional regulator [Prevotella sp.]